MHNKFKTHIVFIIVSLLIFSCTYGSKSNALNYGAEFLGASIGQCVIGIPLTIAGVIGLAYGFGDLDVGPAIAIMGVGGGFVIGSTVGAPLGTMLTGKIMHQRGSRSGAWLGGLLGTGLGLSTILLYSNATANQEQNNWHMILLTAFVLPPLCSVTGYNLFSYKDDYQSMFFNKNIPRIGVTVLPVKHNNKISAKIGLNVSFRF